MWFEKAINHAIKSMLLVVLVMGVALAGDLLKKAKARGEEGLEAPRVTTPLGVVQGRAEDGLVVFKGIPYAAPPVGVLRWTPPQAPASWDGVRDATAFGPGCPLMLPRSPDGRWISAGGADLFVDFPLILSNEDCLTLNVWAPADAEDAAVMVWIQAVGPSATPLFDGASFARDGVVFVSLDYRQLTPGNFAHPALTAEASPDTPLGRFQTLDQMAALRWVEDNIAAFGGDPDNVTVFGQSAGAQAVLELLTVPSAEGLFDKAIVQSDGGWETPWTLAQLERVGEAMAEHAGLADATAEQLRALPLDALPQLGVYSFDGRLQPTDATTAIDEGHLTDVPLLVGWTDYDGSSLRGAAPEEIASGASDELLAAYASDGKSGTELGSQMYTDGHVGAPARWLAGKASDGAPSYLYLFSYVATARRGQTPGAAHGDELPYVFDAWSTAPPQLTLSEEDLAATRMMHDCWVSFAKTGEPACEGVPEWPRYTPDADQLMELGLTPAVRSGFRARQLDAQEAAWRAGADEAVADVEAAILELEESLSGARE